MKMRSEKRNLIIYILALFLVVAGSGLGLVEKQQVFYSCPQDEAALVTMHSLLQDDNISVGQIVERNSIISNYSELRYGRSDFSYRRDVFFLCTLAFLPELFRLGWEEYTLHSDRYILENQYNILFMQDMDGRKRIS